MTGTGRIEAKRDPDFAPETRHSSVIRRKSFERAVKDGLGPAV